MKRGSVQISGAKLSYQIEGTGPPLLVVGSSRYYPLTFSRRLKQFFTLVCADLPHFAVLDTTFRLHDMSFDSYVRSIDAIRTRLEWDNFVIAGHSHHGNIALEYAKQYPNNVSRVVLIGTPPVDLAQTMEGAATYWETYASNERKAILQKNRARVRHDDSVARSPLAQYVAQYIIDAPLYWYDPHYDALWLWSNMSFDMDAVRAFRNLYREYRLNWNATQLSAPVHIVMGRHDYAVPPVLWDGVLPALQNARFHLLERSGHTPQLEEPNGFDQILLDWL